MKEVYSSDQPISCKSEDLFNRAPFASRIAQTIATRSDPSSIVIGLYGPWGNGKTSTLKMIEEDLKEYQDVVTLFFNPWLFKSEEALLRGFFSSLATALGHSLTGAKEKLGNLFKEYGDLISLGSFTLAGGMIGINPGAGVKSLGNTLSTVDIDDSKKKIEEMLKEEKKRIVVFIDDIDRLDRDDTHAIFKLIKLSASFKYTSYVVAFDYDVVSAALAERYGDGGQRAGSAFLEKIIQVPLFLPPVSDSSLRKTVFQGINEALTQAQITLKDKQVNELYTYIRYGFGRKISTPRLVKLYQNALTFVLPLMKGEVNPVDLILIEGVRIIYPHLYKTIQKRYELFLYAPESKDNAKRRNDINLLLDECIQDSTQKDRENFFKFILMYLFPNMLNNCGMSENEREKFQKISSPKYFDRYFQYGIPNDQISDVLVRDLINSFSSIDQDEVNKKLREFYNEGKIINVIGRIKYIYEELSIEQCRKIINAFIQNVDIIPYEEGIFFSSRSNTINLMIDILLKIEFNKERRERLENILNSSLGFAEEFLFHILHNSSEKYRNIILDTMNIEDMEKILLEMAIDENNKIPLYESYPDSAFRLYEMWKKYKGINSLYKTIMDRLKLYPKEIYQFIKCFSGKTYTGRNICNIHISDEGYKKIIEISDADFIVQILKEEYGSTLDDPLYEDWVKEREPRLEIAHQFMYLHQSVHAQKKHSQ